MTPLHPSLTPVWLILHYFLILVFVLREISFSTRLGTTPSDDTETLCRRCQRNPTKTQRSHTLENEVPKLDTVTMRRKIWSYTRYSQSEWSEVPTKGDLYFKSLQGLVSYFHEFELLFVILKVKGCLGGDGSYVIVVQSWRRPMGRIVSWLYERDTRVERVQGLLLPTDTGREQPGETSTSRSRGGPLQEKIRQVKNSWRLTERTGKPRRKKGRKRVKKEGRKRVKSLLGKEKSF